MDTAWLGGEAYLKYFIDLKVKIILVLKHFQCIDIGFKLYNP